MKKLLLLALIISSCAPVYVPNARNSPMFTKAGEFQGGFTVGNGLEGQAAVSVTNHIGIIGNYSYINRQDLNDNKDVDKYLRHKLWEAGIGYYHNDDKMFFEVFAGYGKGEGSSNDQYYFFNNETVTATGKYERYFIQPAFGFNKKMMHVAFVPRIAVVDFSEFTSDAITVSVNEDPKVFFEPGVIGRVNMAENHFFFTFQAGVSFSASGETYFDHRPFQFATGMGFRLGGTPWGGKTEGK